MSIKDGDTIKIDYTGKLDDGSVFDSSEQHGEPLEFTVGANQVISGFEEAVRGMDEGDEKEFRIEPSEAYGEYNENLTQQVPKDIIQSNMDIEEGMMILVRTPDGREMPAKVAEVGDEQLTLDMNHPLAGKALNFNIRVVEA
ncbi:FKBP-type peptidyl-prolyl cis-trans isomerase [Methanolobus halotolerans]|uniref:Peptidyl-prolyl cis-trans isomerase n=1 Tax=Methanolobus halotolerans TaxID=2052935 RepID=A0A4E0PT82_9EURY|nr:peptidylprolyl isomerase [Methanolobus halotolerans]TGC07516.1 peptidylprolyl isomerase [Methanolobus halotolerans]